MSFHHGNNDMINAKHYQEKHYIMLSDFQIDLTCATSKLKQIFYFLYIGIFLER